MGARRCKRRDERQAKGENAGIRRKCCCAGMWPSSLGLPVMAYFIRLDNARAAGCFRRRMLRRARLPDDIRFHERAQRLGYGYAAVLVLIIFQNGGHGTADRDAAAI